MAPTAMTPEGGGKRSAIFLLFLVLSALLAPGILSSWPAALPDGQAVVHNGARGLWDDAPRIKLVFDGMLGRDDDDDYLFYGPEGIAADREGNLYVLDARNHRVQVFDSRHEFLRTFGRKGQGPGDLGRPGCIDVDAAGNVFVGDPGNGRIAVFDAEGSWLRSIPVPATNIAFRVMRNGDLLLRNPSLDGGRGLGRNRVPLFRILGADGKTKREIGQGTYFEKPPFSQGGNRSLMTMDGDGNAYLAFLFQNRICKYAPDGRLLFAADRTLPKDKLIDKALDMYSTINSALDVDSRGRVWVVTYTRKWGQGDLLHKGMINGELVISGDRSQTETDLYEIQIFGPDGALLQKIPITHFCDDMKIVGDTVYLLDMDRLGQFFVYRIEEV